MPQPNMQSQKAARTRLFVGASSHSDLKAFPSVCHRDTPLWGRDGENYIFGSIKREKIFASRARLGSWDCPTAHTSVVPAERRDPERERDSAHRGAASSVLRDAVRRLSRNH